jgi:Pyridine nucleotide-disulphide oxidoreductase/Pyridine nucleotide-disulphide oxidoreductase, dimerisation domain
MIATGRRPNTNGFGLEKALVELGPKGEIMVNKHLQTSNPDIYAAGDCIGDPMFVYVAAYAGSLAVENALTGIGRLYDLSALLRVTFTDPQIASVGSGERQARERGYKVQTAVLDLKNVPRALASRDTRGLIKLVADIRHRSLAGSIRPGYRWRRNNPGGNSRHPLWSHDPRHCGNLPPVPHTGGGTKVGRPDIPKGCRKAFVLRVPKQRLPSLMLDFSAAACRFHFEEAEPRGRFRSADYRLGPC